MTGHVRGDVRKGMHEHQGEPCWDAHCAPHLTHHDAATRELIARAEARGAEWVAQAVEALADAWEREAEAGRTGGGHPLLVQTYAGHAHNLRALLAEHRTGTAR